MKLFNNKRVMKNMNKAIEVMGNAMQATGNNFTMKDHGFGAQDVLALFVKYPELFPEQLHAQIQEFYDLFCAEVMLGLKK